VLMGALSPLQGIGPDILKIKPLLSRNQQQRWRGHSGDESERRGGSDGDLPRAVAQAARRAGDAHRDGRTVGSDLEYTDEVTMHKALEGRREV